MCLSILFLWTFNSNSRFAHEYFKSFKGTTFEHRFHLTRRPLIKLHYLLQYDMKPIWIKQHQECFYLSIFDCLLVFFFFRAFDTKLNRQDTERWPITYKYSLWIFIWHFHCVWIQLICVSLYHINCKVTAYLRMRHLHCVVLTF